MSAPGKRVLIADDNAEFASMLQLALEAAGYAVAVAANGREALALQRIYGAEVLITDLVMPESDGFETIESVRREFPQTKIVVISGQGRLYTPRYLEAAKLMGVDAVLRKPFEVEELLKILQSF
jgi:CheY-like chemotaxis protein